MRNRFTDQHQAGHGRLFVATVSLVPTRVVHTDVAGAVQHLQGSWGLERDKVWSGREQILFPPAHPEPSPSPPLKGGLKESSVLLLLLTPHMLGWVHSPAPSSAPAAIAAFL